MDKRYFFYRQKVTDAELREGFDLAEAALFRLASDHGLWGVVSGYGVTEAAVPNLTVQVAPGTVYDQQGQRVRLGSTQILDVSVDEGSAPTAVITPGNSRILSVFAEFTRLESDPRVDGNSVTVNYVQDESFQLNVVAGAEAVSPVAPALRSDQILIADVTLTFGQTQIFDGDISTARMQWVFKTTSGEVVVAGTAKEAIQILADAVAAVGLLADDTAPDDGATLIGIDAIADSPDSTSQGTVKTAMVELLGHHNAHLNAVANAHPAGAVNYAGGGTWADGTTNPAATVEAQLDKVVTDLGSGTGGTAKVSGAAAAGTPDSLAAGTLKAQLEELLTFVNNRTVHVDPGGRLTLSSGVSVPENVAGATTVYYTPHIHDRLYLYDGAKWVLQTFTEASQLLSDATKSPAAAVVDFNYDVFGWMDGPTFRATRGPAWSDDVTRGVGGGSSELEFFDGRWVNKFAIVNGPAARRGLYLGSIRTDSGAALVTDVSDARRSVWNLYNRVKRSWVRSYSPAPYAYTSATPRQVNAETNNVAHHLVGLDVGDLYSLQVYMHARNTDTGVRLYTGVDVDGGGTIVSFQRAPHTQVANLLVSVSADLTERAQLGWHSYRWLEASDAVGTTTWVMDTVSGGMNGWTWG